MGLASNVLGGIQATPAVMTPQGSAPITPQAAPQAPQFQTPTAHDILASLLASYGAQSIAPTAPGSQAPPQSGMLGGNGQGQSALQQLTGQSLGGLVGQGLNAAGNAAANYLTGGTGGMASAAQMGYNSLFGGGAGSAAGAASFLPSVDAAGSAGLSGAALFA